MEPDEIVADTETFELDGISIRCWAVRRGVHIWARPAEILISHDDIAVIGFSFTYDLTDPTWYRLDDSDTLSIDDPMSWHDDGVRVAADGWVPVSAVPNGAGIGVVFVRPGHPLTVRAAERD